MKAMFENMIGIIVMVFMTFLLSGIVSLEVQTLNARKYHAAVVENIQDSHYRLILNGDGEPDLSRIAVPEGYHLSVSQTSQSYNTRRSFLVRLDYTLSMPLFGFSRDGSIVGYAR